MADNELLVWDASKSQMQAKLGELVQYFQVSIPTNGDGIPKSYIDPAVLFPHLLDIETADDLSNSIITEATIPVEFEDGFPTVGGIPLWERLDGEPVPYYKLFKEYRELKYLQGTRSISKVAETQDIPGRTLNALARIYHWQARVKAFDIFKGYELQLKKQKEIEKLESRHSTIANEILEQAAAYLDSHPEQLSPKIALQMIEMGMRTGRLALGLNPDKPGGAGTGSDGTGSGKGPNININNNIADHMNQLNIGGVTDGNGNAMLDNDGLSAVQRATEQQSQDAGTLKSILHVLSKAGAFKASIAGSLEKEPDTDIDYENDEEADNYEFKYDEVDNGEELRAKYEVKDAK